MTLQAERHTFQDWDDVQDAYYKRGWTDGLPIVPPTPDKVEQFLAYAGLESGEVLGTIPTREVTTTAEHVAINAVMAGCQVEYMPVVVAAIRAILEDKGHAHSTTGSLWGPAHPVIVNGPIRRELDINSEAACFGPGWRANATIGRALRLVVRNVFRGIPGFLDRATFSTPARYTWCFGEDEENSPWKPLHVERGFSPEQSTATVFAVTLASIAGDDRSRTPEGVLDTLVATTRKGGVIGDKWLGDNVNVIMILGREHSRYLWEAGWSKDDMRDYMFPRIMEPPGAGESTVKLGKPEGILIVAAGGWGMAQTWILHPHVGWAITKPIEAGRT